MNALMSVEERSLYNLQRTLIHRHFGGLQPRPVGLIDAADFDGRAREPRLELGRRLAASRGDCETMILHLLIHYEMKDSGQPHWYGHGPYFTRRASELEIYAQCVFRRCFSMEDWLNNPFLRSGPHAVQARVIDVLFGLAQSYRRELLELFTAERFDPSTAKVPQSLVPWIKFYAAELAGLLAVLVDIEKMTPGA